MCVRGRVFVWCGVFVGGWGERKSGLEFVGAKSHFGPGCSNDVASRRAVGKAGSARRERVECGRMVGSGRAARRRRIKPLQSLTALVITRIPREAKRRIREEVESS